MKRYISLMVALGMIGMIYACNGEEPSNDSVNDNKTEQKGDSGSTDKDNSDTDIKDAATDNGICEEGEAAIKVYCDNYHIVTRHADPACGKDNTTWEEVSCFKYAYVVEEADNYTFNQKGTCKEINGVPTCVRDEEYVCSDAFKHKVKCVAGYKIGYWSVASCGEVTVEKTDSCSEE